MAINRELSQFASFVSVDDNTKKISIGTTSSTFVGIGTTNPSTKFEVLGDTKLQTLNVSGVSTFSGITTTITDAYIGTNLYVKNSATFDISTTRNLTVTGTGIITNISGVAGTITRFNATTGIITNISGVAGTITTLNATSGIITNISGVAGTITTLNATTGIITNISGVAGTITTLNATTGNITNINGALGIITNISGTNLNYSGISTFNNLNVTGTAVTFNNGLYVSSGTAVVNSLTVFPGPTNISGSVNFFNNINSSGIITATSFSGNASSATYATSSGVSTSVNGGTASVTSLSVTGLSTFTNGPVLIGTGTSTGTVGQVLQVAGINSSVYIGGRVGMGNTNPSTVLDIFTPSPSATIGNIRITPTGNGQARYHLYNGGAQAEWIFGQKTATWHPFTISKLVAGSESDYFTIDTSGNVGIGTTNPQYTLDVFGNARVTGVVTATTFSGNLANTLTLNTSGTGLSGSTTFNNSGVSTFTVTSNATSTNTTSTIVSRDASGNFSAGIITATTFSGSLSGNASSATYATSSGVSTSVNSGTASVTSLNVSGISTLGITSATNLTSQQLNVSGLSTFSGITTYSASVFGTQASFTGVVTATTFSGNASSATYATSSGISTSVNGGIASVTSLSVTGLSTFTNGPVLIGTGTSTGTVGQVLQVAGINSSVYIGGNLGIGTTTPTSKLTVSGDVLVSGIITSRDYNSSSDLNLKENVLPISNPVDKVLKLTGVTFDWKETGQSSMGVIAQEVEQVLPELVNGTDSKTVNYNGLIGLLIEVVKDQQVQINNLKEKIK